MTTADRPERAVDKVETAVVDEAEKARLAAEKSTAKAKAAADKRRGRKEPEPPFMVSNEDGTIVETKKA